MNNPRNNPKEIFFDTFVDVIEKTAFMFGEPAEDSEIDWEENIYRKVSISFFHQVKGQMIFIFPIEMGKELAGNMLGADFDDEITDEQAFDALRELANVTCGNFVTAWLSENSEVDLTIPEISPISSEKIVELSDNENYMLVQVDDYPVLITLELE